MNPKTQQLISVINGAIASLGMATQQLVDELEKQSGEIVRLRVEVDDLRAKLATNKKDDGKA